MSKPANRKQAQALGLKTYFTGKPCKPGGIADRRLNGDCLCSVCASFTLLLKSEWAVKNKHKRIEWAALHPKKMKAYKTAWQEKNKVEQAERIKLWKHNHPERVYADFHKRRASKIKATPCWYGEFDKFVMVEAFKLAKLRKDAMGMNWHVDHMIPLQSKQASGLHCASNIQVIPECINVSKANRMIYSERNEWLQCL